MTHQNIAVKPPCDADIKKIREAAGSSQQHAADLVSLSSRGLWTDYEAGRKRPSPQSWGLFLLAIDQHPLYSLTKKPSKTEGDHDE